MSFVVDVRHLKQAARACMRRAGAPGTDGMGWAEYRQGLSDRLAALAGQLRAGTWEPGPVREVEITAYTGKVFTAVIPTVEDRVVQRAIRHAIEPVLEARAFAAWVSGYRAGRNRITALRDADRHLREGLRWVADVDVRQVSAGSSASEVAGWLAEHVADGPFLRLFERVLEPLPYPIVPGTALAPLLINLRLSRADSALAGYRVVRFADNYCLFCEDRAQAQEAMAAVAEALGHCGLEPHPGKSQVRAGVNTEDLFLIAG
ncbi:reverse transcriptase domain-containing protein [Kitasatospora purpeofusca]|uniref:reverse transcriptase domain-containing protein n=1 Tax=Kitasatospora purpeofusca TaxID=67352 RepID=UPI00224E458A|nr:reverse transcriptase domain-containing protein [Kitasatospora purpeofusca]MCX4758665.1 reverse transcriptase domain-containing protein [Kitasatospora purpeofusca]WSR30900.1 reverse transcriptase domain-containing protein [Kitasatospora purpeofusca]